MPSVLRRDSATTVHAFIHSRVDHCYAILVGISDYRADTDVNQSIGVSDGVTRKMQSVLYAAARLSVSDGVTRKMQSVLYAAARLIPVSIGTSISR